MKFFLTTILLSLSVFLTSCAEASNDKVFIDKMDNRLHEASWWLVESGIAYLDSNSESELRSLLIDRWSVQLWVDPRVDDDRFYASFRLKARGIYYDIICLHRLVEDRIYEYWVIKRSAEPSVELEKGCVFLAAVADGPKGERVVLKTSETFVPRFELKDGVSLEFPVDDNRLLYDLAAWKFPSCYPDSELKNVEIEIVDGEYVKVDGERRRQGS